MSLCPAIFDCNVLAFDKAPVFQTLTERSQELRVVAGRPGAEEPNHRHRRLLRLRRERPRGRRAREKGDELAALHLIELHSVPSSQAGLQDIELARISQEVMATPMVGQASILPWT